MPIVRFPRFVGAHSRILAFGLLTSFFSSFGQTFYVGAYSDPLREAFGLTYGQIGGVYSLATLSSAIALMWTGRPIDHMPLERYATRVSLALIGACWLMSAVPTTSVLWLGLAFFALRQSGQGLMSHTSVTSIARRFTEGRGRALSIAVLGFPLGQAVLPAIAVALTRAVGWRASWAIVAGLLTIGLVPLLRWLLRGHERSEMGTGAADPGAPAELLSPARATVPAAGATSASPHRPWTRADVLRDARFWLIIPAATAPGVLATGIFFHQAFITASKGWDLAGWTAFFPVFAGVQIALSLAAGPLIDRIGSPAVMRVMLLPMAIGLALLTTTDQTWLIPAFLGLTGITAGLSMTLGGALWAELYGVAHLGAIRATVASLMILGTASTPAGMGMLIDAGWGLSALSWLSAGYVVLATGAAVVGLQLRGTGGAGVP